MNKTNKKASSKKKFIKRNPKNYQDDMADEEFLKGSKFPQSKVRHNSNDPQWYFKDANVLRDVASFSYEARLGSSLHLDTTLYPPTAVNDSMLSISGAAPGLLSMEIALTPGIAESAQSPINLAATNVYSFVRYKNSGAANYDAPDLILYLLAMDSIYAMWNWMKRIYGIASLYSQTNLYYPRALMEANNVDLDDVLANLADFRAFLNVKAGEVSAFCVPATMTYNIRHSWLFSNIYLDSDTNKAQTYMFVPSYFYKYQEVQTGKGGSLVPVPVLLDMPNTLYTVDDIEEMFNSLIESVQYAEDIGIMSGDILKAYGEGGLFRISTFEPDYRVEPVYNQEVLSQIENLNVLSHSNQRKAGTLTPEMFQITQNPDTNWLQFQPTNLVDAATMDSDSQFLNFHWPNPTPENAMVATRLKSVIGIQDGVSTVISCGSEIVIDARMWFYGYSDDPTAYQKVVPANRKQPGTLNSIGITPEIVPDTNGVITGNIVDQVLLQLQLISCFDWHPTVKVFNEVTRCYSGPYLDLDKYTIITAENMEAMHLVALLSEFNVPN